MSRNWWPLSMMGAAVAVTLGSQSAIAVQDEDIDFDTTEDLYQVCSVEPGTQEHIAASFACRGFIEGAVQYHDAVSDRKNLKRLICYPQTATVAKPADAVCPAIHAARALVALKSALIPE